MQKIILNKTNYYGLFDLIIMDKELFKALSLRYTPLISNIINNNVKFFRFRETIKWRFGFDECVAIFACCDSKTKILTINIGAVDYALRINEPLHIEYFILHEIRHIYQYMEIDDHMNNSSACINPELAKKWANEVERYTSAIDKDGNENPEYYKQDLEFDAFAFAFAVIKHKYGDIPYIQKPTKYGEEFDRTVGGWCQTFQSENL